MQSAEAVCLDCCVCGRESKEMRLIGSKRTVNLSELLAKYGGISKQQGKICRNCFTKLKTVHKNASKIRQQCLNTQAKTKQCHQALQSLLTNVNGDSIKDGKEIYVQVQATELAIFKEENLMPEELIYKPVTIGMKEKIKYLEMEVLQLKSDLQYLRELHKTNIRIMINSCAESIQKVMNKVSRITANDVQHEDILDDTEIFINKPFSSRIKGCSSNAMDHLYCKDISIKVEPESDIDDATELPDTDYIDQYQNSPVTLNTIKTEQQLPSLGLDISNIRSFSGEISDDVIECSKIMTPQSKSIKRKRTSAHEENERNKEVKSLKLDSIDHQNIIEEKPSMVSLDTSVTKPFVVVGEHYKQITQNTTQQLQNILNLSHLNMKKENIAINKINENMMTHKPIIFPVIIQKALPAGSHILRNELLKKDVIIGGSPLKTENMSMKNQVVFNVNSSPNKEQTEKDSYSASFQVKYHKICPKPSKDVDVSKLPECGNDGMEVKAEETKNYYPRPQLPIPNKSQICYVCGKFIEKRDSMTSHLKTHSEKMFKCNICDRAFVRKNHMLEHLNTHSREKPYVCHLCGKEIRFESSFIKHMKIHKGDKRHSCDDCGKRFMDKSLLLNHRRKWHESNNVNRRYKKQRTFTCKTSGCGKKYLDICELRKHQLEHPSEKLETEPNVCPDCNEIFDNEEACKKHIPVHLENLPYGCGTCGKSFSKTVHLQTHMAVHTKKSRFRCSTCSLVFFSGKSFTEHVKTHTDTENMCNDCGQSFPDVRTLEDHIPEHSREDLLYGCGFCDKGFSKPSHLKYHMKKHEFDERM